MRSHRVLYYHLKVMFMKRHSFKFLDDSLNRELIDSLKGAGLDHSIDDDGVIHYSEVDRGIVEDELICAIRQKVFAAWQIVTCPSDWTTRYLDYMRLHEIPLKEELSDGELWFLIPRKYRPHSWKLDASSKPRRLAENRAS